MKEFILKELLLVSLKERKAKKVRFDDRRTVIIGKNSTGKSCLLKSIYRTFGAEPQNIHPNWKDANVVSFIRFTINKINYSIIKNESQFGLYDSNNQTIGIFNKVSDLGEVLADLFDFKIQLTNRKGEIVTPPPAYLFLPYYADQDKSWTANWESFDKLYLPNTRNDIVNYHTGIKPNEYYIAKNELKLCKEQINEINKEIKILNGLLNNLNKKLSESNFNIDLDDFQEEITELLGTCEKLNASQNELKYSLNKLNNQKIDLENQLSITKKALAETHDDYQFAVDDLEEIVECPCCGAEYENDFSVRFEIAQDEDRCLDLIVELKEDLKELDTKVFNLKTKFKENNLSIKEIEKILSQKKEKIKLRDLIESEGKREMKKIFVSEISEYEEQLKEKLLKELGLDAEKKKYEDRKHSSKITKEYKAYMNSFLKNLNVHSLSEKSYKRISSKIKESGSAMPRSLMAYYFSILHIIRKYGTSTFCPIVIDSPNQQGQDSENLPILLEFIVRKQPDNSQLILAVEETHNIDFDAKMIYLETERSLLQEDEYESVFEEIKPFFNALLDF